MCVDCNNETLTGVVYYSGLDFTICGNITITNGEDMNVVLSKIEQCLDFINLEFDITGLTENSDCISFAGTKLKDILQGLINTDSSYCTRIKDLEDRVLALETALNSPQNVYIKGVNINTCEAGAISKVTTTTQTGTTLDFNLNVGLVPKKTILPYFGPRSDFDVSGLGIGHLKGWAISNGNNGTINACDKFIHYECDICCDIYGGENQITISVDNLPNITQENIEVSLSGTTSEAGLHNHNIAAQHDHDDAGTINPSIVYDPVDCGGETQIYGPNPIEPGDTSSYCNHVNAIATSTTPILKSGKHTHTYSTTGTFSIAINNDNDPIAYMPEHIKAFPIEFVGC